MGALRLKTKAARIHRLPTTERRCDGKLVRLNRIDGGLRRRIMRDESLNGVNVRIALSKDAHHG